MTGADDGEEEPIRGIARFPCDKMSGTVMVRDPESFREIHILALRHIRKDGRISTLLEAFGLGERVMQEVVADLVFGEAIRIDLDQDLAAVREPYASYLEDDNIEDIQARLYQTREIKVTWLLDRSTGQVFAGPQLKRYTSHRGEVGSYMEPRPPAGDVPDLRQTDNTVLARAALPVLADVIGDDEIDLSQIEHIEGKRRLRGHNLYIPVKGVSVGGQSEDYLIPDAPGIPRSVRDAWTVLLNKGRDAMQVLEAEDRPEEVLFGPRLLASEIQEALEELETLARSDIGSAKNVDRINVLLDRLKAWFRHADDMERSQGNVEVIVGPRPSQLEFLEDSLSEAEDSVVLGSAFVSEAGIGEVLSILEDSVQDGVRISLVQGLPEDGRMGEALRSLRGDTEDVDSGLLGHLHVHRARRPFHGKFVVIDAEEVAVSSHNWLTGGGDDGPQEATIATDAPLTVAETVAEILEWMPADAPEVAPLSKKIRNTRRRDRRSVYFKKVFKRIEETWERFYEERSASARDDFEGELQEALEVVSEIPRLESVLPVVDADHRGHLFRFTEEAESSLLITSDGVASEAAGNRLANSIGRALRTGVDVEIIWGRQKGDDPEAGRSTKAVERLREALPAKSDGQLALPSKPCRNHAKILVVDRTQALVSSFNFLSFGAVKRDSNPFAGELGLLVFDKAIAAKITDAFEDN